MALEQAHIQALLGSKAPMEDSHPKLLGMLYGDSGTGKTVLAARIAEALGGRWAYVDYKEGFTTLAINPRWRHLTRFMQRFKYEGLSQLHVLSQAIQERVPGFEFDGIITDEFSSMCEKNLLDVTKARAKKDPGKDPSEPKQPDMMASTNLCKDAFNSLLAIDCHLLVLSHVRKDQDDLKISVTSPKFMPALSGTLREPMQLVGHVTADLVNNMAVEEYKRWVQIAPTRSIVAKTRIDGLAPRVDFDSLINALSGFARGERKLVSDSLTADTIDDSTSNTDQVEVY